MQNNLLDQKVSDVQSAITDSHRVLRHYRIDATNHMRLSVAAEAASVTTDELLAVLDDRMRRAARRAAAAARVHEHHEEEVYA
jgi:hypothetical protein